MILVSILRVLQTTSYLILALLCIMFMIVVYEFGHYLAGKVLGFKIIEFGVGFGPPFYKRESKKNGEVFSISSIGRFCQFEYDSDHENKKVAFSNQYPFNQMMVLLFWALFNFVLGLLLVIVF